MIACHVLSKTLGMNTNTLFNFSLLLLTASSKHRHIRSSPFQKEMYSLFFQQKLSDGREYSIRLCPEAALPLKQLWNGHQMRMLRDIQDDKFQSWAMSIAIDILQKNSQHYAMMINRIRWLAGRKEKSSHSNCRQRQHSFFCILFKINFLSQITSVSPSRFCHENRTATFFRTKCECHPTSNCTGLQPATTPGLPIYKTQLTALFHRIRKDKKRTRRPNKAIKNSHHGL